MITSKFKKYIHAWGKLKKSGMTLIELMVSMGILSVVMYQFISGSSFIQGFYHTTQNTLAMEDVALSVYENIRGNVNLYQIDFAPTNFTSTISYTDLQTKLPYAWDSKKIIDQNTCPIDPTTSLKVCPLGRLGYMISPISGYRGLLKLTIRVTHPDILANKFKDYTFLINGN